jgi:hypothetical protein
VVIPIVVCPNCGKNTPEGKFCEHCGASLQTPQTFQQPPAQQPVFTQQPAGARKEKNAIGAAIASAVWAGLGQTYNGQLAKGLGFWLGLFFFYALTTTGGEFFTLFVIIIWAYGVYDAYSTANKINSGQIPYSDTKIGHFAGFVIGSIIIAIIIFAVLAALFMPYY